MTPQAAAGSGGAVGARRLRWPLLVAGLLALVGLGLGGYSGGIHIWAEYHYRAARTALDRRDTAKAEAHMAACLKVWPHSALAHLRAAEVARQANDLDRAEAHLTTCLQLGPPKGFELERGLYLAQQGQLSDNLVKFLDRSRQEEPEAAVRIFEALSRGYMQTYRLTDLLACVDAWLQCRPDDGLAYFRRGWAYERMELIQEAQQAYRKALELNPTDEATQFQLAQTLLRAGSPTEAAALLEPLRRQEPGKMVVGLSLAEAKRQLGRLDEARGILEELAAQYPRDPQVLVSRGRVARELGQSEEAEVWLRQAVALAPFSFEANYGLWECLRARGKTGEANECEARVKQIEADQGLLKSLFRELQDAPSAPSLRCEIGKAYLRLGNDEQGLRWLHMALQEDPQHQATQRALAEYYQQNQPATFGAPPHP
jgi:tetratricopeptide (TPR) repeat protein